MAYTEPFIYIFIEFCKQGMHGLSLGLFQFCPIFFPFLFFFFFLSLFFLKKSAIIGIYFPLFSFHYFYVIIH